MLECAPIRWRNHLKALKFGIGPEKELGFHKAIKWKLPLPSDLFRSYDLLPLQYLLLHCGSLVSGHQMDNDTYYSNATHRDGPPENWNAVSRSQDLHLNSVQDLNTLHEPPFENDGSQANTQHVMAYHQERIYFAPQQKTGTKRSRQEDLELESRGPGQQMHPFQKILQIPSVRTGWDDQQMENQGYSIPNQGHRSKIPRMSQLIESTGGAAMVIGTEILPNPAPKPSKPKSKFAPEDDELLIDLKENHSLTWKQIAEFFPGRSSGTLQVRYCTKLKIKTPHWTDETIQKLRVALHDYEQEKWRIIAQKVGTGFTSTACRDKADELDAPTPNNLIA